MATVVVCIVCLALIMMGGMTLSQGILTSADTTAQSFDNMMVREGELMRTSVSMVRAEYLSWSDLVRVTIDNSGQTKIGEFDNWDIIISYEDSEGANHYTWLPYTEGTLSDNEWQKASIWLEGQPETFEPGLLNPQEELVILAKLNPLPGDLTSGEVTAITGNGISDVLTIEQPGSAWLTSHSESFTIHGEEYFQMAESSPADGNAMIITTDAFATDETGRKILYNENDSSQYARMLFPLTGINQIPAQTWTVYYHCRTWGGTQFPQNDSDVNFNIDILVRKADGTIRATLATDVASAYLTAAEGQTWVTKSGVYSFPGYTVVDESDYLEIVYYGESDSNGPSEGSGYLQIRIDDNTLGVDDQTRIIGTP